MLTLGAWAKLATIAPLLLHVDALVPIKLNTASLETREVRNIGHILRPSNEVHSSYIHESFGDGYVISVIHSHEKLRYVSLDDLEDFDGTMHCGDDSESTLKMTFANPEHHSTARDLWKNESGLVFSTSHPECAAAGERSFFRVKSLVYSSNDLTVHVDSDVRSLSDPLVEDESIVVNGGPTEARYSTISRRDVQQVGDTHYYNGTLDLNQPFPQTRATLFTSPSFNVTCVDCSISGQIFPSFSVTVANNSAILNNVINGDNNTSINSLFQDVSLGAMVTEAINANITLEIQSIGKFDAHCSIPPTDCDAEITASGQGGLGKSLLQVLSNPGSFLIGNLQFQPDISYGLRFELDVEADTTLTLPFTSYTPQNDSVSFSTGASPVLDLHPSLNFGQPSLSVNSGTACVTVALGPEASFSIEPGGGGAPLLSIGGEIDIPKFETCASEANNVDEHCNPNGPFVTAIELRTNVSAGIELDAGALSVFQEDTGDALEVPLYARQDCFNVGGISNQTAPGQPGSVPTNSTNGTLATAPYKPSPSPSAAHTGAGALVVPSISVAIGLGMWTTLLLVF